MGDPGLGPRRRYQPISYSRHPGPQMTIPSETKLEVQASELDSGADANAAAPLLATDKLVKEYRQRRVVNGVSITVGAGEVVGLLGPNGAGKTTTFNIVVGLIKP